MIIIPEFDEEEEEGSRIVHIIVCYDVPISSRWEMR